MIVQAELYSAYECSASASRNDRKLYVFFTESLVESTELQFLYGPRPLKSTGRHGHFLN